MILRQTRGIIIRSLKYSETSLILDIYTIDHGLRSFIISGVRKSKSKTSASLLQLLNIIEFTAYQSDADKLSRIKEFHIHHKYVNLTYEVVRTSVGIFLIELVRNCVREKEENNSMYVFIENTLKELDNKPMNELSNFYLQFMISLTEHLGFFPMKNYDEHHTIFDLMNGRFVIQNESSKYTIVAHQSHLLNYLINEPSTFKCDKNEREELVTNLLLYYSLHVPEFRPMKSLDVLREVMRG